MYTRTLYISGQLTVDCDFDSDSFWVNFPQLIPSSPPVYLSDIHSLDECQQACKTTLERCTAVEFIQDQRCEVYGQENIAKYDRATTEETSITMFLQVCLEGKSCLILFY